MNKWSAYFIYHAYQPCILSLFHVVSNLLEFFNFNGDDDDDEKRLLGQRRASPLAKMLLFTLALLHSLIVEGGFLKVGASVNKVGNSHKTRETK